MVRVGDIDGDVRNVAFSTDGDATWFAGSEPSGVTKGGTVAAAAEGSRFVWLPGSGQVVHSVGFGGSWAQSTGVPAGAIVESDRLNPNRFYAYANGSFSVSTNGGASLTATAASGLPSSGVKFKAVPGLERDIWLAGESGLYRSTDSGAKLPGISSAVSVRFGKAAPGRTYPALYAVATIGGVTDVVRSDDTGASWTRINDDQHQYGNMGNAITGDPGCTAGSTSAPTGAASSTATRPRHPRRRRRHRQARPPHHRPSHR